MLAAKVTPAALITCKSIGAKNMPCWYLARRQYYQIIHQLNQLVFLQFQIKLLKDQHFQVTGNSMKFFRDIKNLIAS